VVKKTKTEVSYQNFPKALQRCEKCTMFVSPSGCTAVQGSILPHGWCRLFKLRRAK